MLPKMQSGAQCLIVFSLAFALSWYVLKPGNTSCVLLITGESVRLVNCELTKDLVEAVATLRPLKHL
uniref:Movement protein TGBp3 n=1 Tax=Potato virus S TaxID=12169 RepID=R4S371_9VIRU|nr:7K protein [Potato virus S]AMR70499.1 7 kDa protein [Potato virus S]AWL13542.1 triple gene block protein 3 [Potato virus S]QWT83675.1 triple gene block protein 3 [Potato virus S]UWY10611.1 TGB3 [Potato virus S]